MLIFLRVKLVLESHLANKKNKNKLALMLIPPEGLSVARSGYPACTLPGSELRALPGVDQAVDAEAVVEVAVELSSLRASKRVVVDSAVEMQALGVLRRPRLLVQVVRAQGRNVPVGQLVDQSQGALPAGGP